MLKNQIKSLKVSILIYFYRNSVQTLTYQDIEDAGIHIISRLRNDAVLMYLFKGKPKMKKGRPRKYAGKIAA